LSYTNKRDRAKIHRIVYPPDVLRENGGHVDLDAIEAEAADLHRGGDPQQAARFFGNIVVAGGGRAVDPDAWDSLAHPIVGCRPGTYIGLGFDGSISEDATVLRAARPTVTVHLGKWVKPAGAGG
jgi:hypothetical protein